MRDGIGVIDSSAHDPAPIPEGHSARAPSVSEPSFYRDYRSYIQWRTEQNEAKLRKEEQQVKAINELSGKLMALPVTPGIPTGFSGSWNVQARRVDVFSQPQYTEQSNTAYPPSLTFNLKFSKNKSNTKLQTYGDYKVAPSISETTGNSAIIKFEKQKNRVQEEIAFVIQLSQDKNHFEGLEEITIQNDSESKPRVRAFYKLSGVRTLQIPSQ